MAYAYILKHTEQLIWYFQKVWSGSSGWTFSHVDILVLLADFPFSFGDEKRNSFGIGS